MKDKVIKIPVIRCEVCGKKEATRFCDYIRGQWRWAGHPPKYNADGTKSNDTKMNGIITCDKQMCTSCSSQIEGNDYCPDCWSKLKNKILKEL